MANSEYGYMVRSDEDIIVLIRFKNGAVETYRPWTGTDWVRTPTKDSILEGSGDWIWYEDVPEGDVDYWMKKVREFNDME